MTSFLLAGYLAVSGGRRIASENASTHKTTHHVFYDTVIQTCGLDLTAEIRHWAPNNDALLPDGTIVDILAKVYAPPKGGVQLDAIHIIPFPGDADSSTYEDHIPQRAFPTLIVLGHMAASAEIMDDGISVGYQLQASDYVRDQSRSSRVYCRFDGNKPRWKKTPRPPSGTGVFVVGTAFGVYEPEGHIMVDVEHVQLNVGSRPASVSAARVEAGGPPAKRRRFPMTPASANAPSSSREINPFANASVPEETVEEDAASPAAPVNPEEATKSKRAAAGRRTIRGAVATARRDENGNAEE